MFASIWYSNAEATEQNTSNNGAEQQMKTRRLTIISLLWTFLSPLCAGDLGPPIGSRFPESNLKSILGPKGAVIAAGLPLRDIEPDQEAFRKLGLRIAAAKSKIHPGWYVLDASGVIVAKYFDDTALYTPAAILVHQFGWTPVQPPTTVEGKQLTAMAGASNTTVAPGERIALILDLDLQPNMHVYAPGVGGGYISIDWKIQDSPAAAVHPAIFPRSKKLYLKPIGETVPVYRGHFRLTRDITIPPEHQLRPALDGSGRFTVPGSLRYQACDDRVCYIPQELHLTWTFRYEAPQQP
jgi:hypothetical protein